MEIDIARIADIAILRLRGDFKNRAEISAAFWKHLQNGVSKFVLNFDGVLSVNSTALTALAEMQRLAEASGGCVRICNLGGQAWKQFQAYKVDSLFSILQDENTALGSMLGAVPVNCGEVCQSRYLN